MSFSCRTLFSYPNFNSGGSQPERSFCPNHNRKGGVKNTPHCSATKPQLQLQPLTPMKIPTAATVSLALLAAVVSPRADALTTQTTGLSATERRSWESFVEYAIEYEKEYRSLDNDHHVVQRRFAVRLRVSCSNGLHVFISVWQLLY